VSELEVEQVGEPPRTGGRRKVVAVLVLLVLLAPASYLARIGASKLEFFHLRSVSIEGTRYLAPETVMERLGLDTMRSVWDDTDPLAERIARMSQVTAVEISRKPPGRLVVRIQENLPVALAPSPRGLEAVDTAGVVLPIDPVAEELDLPVAEQRDIELLRLLGAVRAGDPRLYRRISEISRDGRSSMVLLLEPLVRTASGGSGEITDSTGAPIEARAPSTLRVRVPLGVSVSRLADIFPVESDLARRRAKVAELDLRYRDQVIARLQ